MILSLFLSVRNDPDDEEMMTMTKTLTRKQFDATSNKKISKMLRKGIALRVVGER